MYVLRILACVLLAGISVAQAQIPKDTNKKPPTSAAPKDDKTRKICPGQPTVIRQNIFDCEPGKYNSEHCATEAANPSRGWVEWLNAFSTAVIAFFTIVMAIAVVLQVKTARNTDRAWITVSPVEKAPEIGFIPTNLGDPVYQGMDTRNAFAASYKNTGNTPARLLESKISYKRVARLEDIPPIPEYAPKVSWNELLLVKEDSIGEIDFLEPTAIVSQAEMIAVQQQQSFWYAYGIVVYKDAFGKKHETQFGYLYHFPLGGDPLPREFRRERMPAAYNKAT